MKTALKLALVGLFLSGSQACAQIANTPEIASKTVGMGPELSREMVGGTMHVADYVFREDLQIANDGVIGATLLSTPTVDLSNRKVDPKRDALYYGTSGDRSEQSVVNYVDGRKIPVLVGYAEYEPVVISDQVRRLIDALTQRDGQLPLITSAVGHNHISLVSHIGSADESLAPDMIEFILQNTIHGQ